jgi:hypothetical protein
MIEDLTFGHPSHGGIQPRPTPPPPSDVINNIDNDLSVKHGGIVQPIDFQWVEVK